MVTYPVVSPAGGATVKGLQKFTLTCKLYALPKAHFSGLCGKRDDFYYLISLFEPNCFSPYKKFTEKCQLFEGGVNTARQMLISPGEATPIASSTRCDHVKELVQTINIRI